MNPLFLGVICVMIARRARKRLRSGRGGGVSRVRNEGAFALRSKTGPFRGSVDPCISSPQSPGTVAGCKAIF